MAIDLKNLTIAKAHQHLSDGDFSAVELADAVTKQIKEKNEDINAYIEVFDDIEVQAKKADELLSKKEGGVLTGIPLGIKDNTLIQGKEATAASNILKGHIATYDAGVISQLKKAGAIFLGRTNMDDAAMGSSTETSCYGPTKNPRDTRRVPGGSSGGSAAAVAMDGALGALGSDTGGSIRQPAAFCGVVGMKPTYGAVSRSGLIAMASSLDQIGPFAKTVEDAEILYNAISAYDEMDSTSVPEDIRKKYHREKKDKYTVGVPADFVYTEGIDKDVLNNFKASLEHLKSLGHSVKEISLPNIKYSLAVYYVIMPAEASTNLARYDGVRYGFLKEGKDLLADYANTRGVGFGKEVRRRIMLGTYVLSSGYYDAYYNKAVAVRNIIEQDFKEAFTSVDFIVTPTTPSPAFKFGEKTADPLQMYLEDIFTVPANLAGIPGISIPSGVVKKEGKDIPLAIQFLAPQFNEEILFAIGKQFERL